MGPKPLSREQIASIVHAINTGAITLPELPEMQDKDLVSIWALVDAGSAVRVVDFSSIPWNQGTIICSTKARG